MKQKGKRGLQRERKHGMIHPGLKVEYSQEVPHISTKEKDVRIYFFRKMQKVCNLQ